MRNSWLALSLVAAFVSGCHTCQDYSLTARLWGTARDPNFRPAPDTELQLFAGTNSRPSVLAVYNELDTRKNSVHRRACMLSLKASPDSERARPVFVSPEAAASLQPIPCRTSMPPGLAFAAASGVGSLRLWAQPWPDNSGFTLLYSDSGDLGDFSLPVYGTGRRLGSQVLLTPVAVLGDIALVGLAAHFMYSP